MLMIYRPSGFDQYLVQLNTMTDADFSDQTKIDALDEKYDIIKLGGVSDRVANRLPIPLATSVSFNGFAASKSTQDRRVSRRELP
ncbi:hypothetical protein [uncultured Roseobacter sp.]|uniref:hypothetical protein n=1 Tax=uncultured Roseobacter sp. TaxID=114847 RepID=UPI002625FB29|nr:hypothetical protein [uncultured Roseobacter sp.]